MRRTTTPEQVTEWLQIASRASDLAPSRRLDAKLDMSPEGVTARLQEASDLLDLCVQLSSLR